MPWLLTSPGNQQQWYWLCRICKSWSYLRRIINTWVISMWSNDIKCKYLFIFPLKNLACNKLNYNCDFQIKPSIGTNLALSAKVKKQSYVQWICTGDRMAINPVLNSLRPSDAYMRRWTGSSLLQIMAFRLVGAKPLSEPMLGYCKFEP